MNPPFSPVNAKDVKLQKIDRICLWVSQGLALALSTHKRGASEAAEKVAVLALGGSAGLQPCEKYSKYEEL
jgi:hypothetical protein